MVTFIRKLHNTIGIGPISHLKNIIVMVLHVNIDMHLR